MPALGRPGIGGRENTLRRVFTYRLVQFSRYFTGGLDARAHRAASDAPALPGMANAASNNLCAIITALLRGSRMLTWFARNMLLPTRPRARRLADWCRVGRLYAMAHELCALCVCTCSRLGTFISGDFISIVMRYEKRVRTKKRVTLCVISLATQREQ